MDAEEIDQITRPTEKITYVLKKIARSLQCGITNSFNALLQIMEKYGGDIAELASNIRNDLSGNPNVNSFLTVYLCNMCMLNMHISRCVTKSKHHTVV